MATATLERMAGNGQLALDEALYEVVNGEKREVAPMGAFAATIASMLSGWLNAFAAPRKLGFAVTETVFEWSSPTGKQQRRPDVAFVRFDRWQPPPDWHDDPPVFLVVPNLAVEVVSPTNKADEVETKIVDYSAAGVELVWVIYPRQRRVYVHDSPANAKVLLHTDELDGGNVLPGFRLKVADLFTVPGQPTP